jgi:hypothetical protein
MRLFAAIALLAGLTLCAFGQGRPIGDAGVVRIQIFHADPYLVKALLQGSGTYTSAPEMSTIMGFAGVADKDSELIESIFGGKGRFVVNPTDNSLLFFPEKK